MMDKIMGFFLTKLLTGKVLSGITITVLEYLAKRSDNKLDDELVALLREALN